MENPRTEDTVTKSLLRTVREVRAKYGALEYDPILEREAWKPPLKNYQMGELLNEVAWRHRKEGWGLAEKRHGAHTYQPFTGVPISRDLLVLPHVNEMYDVLRDVAGEAEPSWSGPMPQDLPFVAPVRPADAPEADTPRVTIEIKVEGDVDVVVKR